MGRLGQLLEEERRGREEERNGREEERKEREEEAEQFAYKVAELQER